MRWLLAGALALLAGCGGAERVELDESALPAAERRVAELYTNRRGARFVWAVVEQPRIVRGCEPEWPELSGVPPGDCVEAQVGGGGCAPAQIGEGLTRQQALRVVRVWLAREGGRWRVTRDAWQTAGGADSGERCR